MAASVMSMANPVRLYFKAKQSEFFIPTLSKKLSTVRVPAGAMTVNPAGQVILCYDL